MKQILKVLSKDMKSPINGDFQYEIGVDYHCPDFDDSDEPCSRGFYGCEIDSLIHWMKAWDGHRLFICSVWGKSKVLKTKERWEFIRLDRELTKEEIVAMCKAQEPRLGYKLSDALYPFNPLTGEPKQPTDHDIDLFEQWIKVYASGCALVYDSVRALVRSSVYDSVYASVYDSVRALVRSSVYGSGWYSVYASVYASVYDSVSGYTGSLFPNIAKWKYVDHEQGVYPFQSAVDLWHRGFVPSFDGKTWRLHSGEEAVVVFVQGEK